MLRHGREGRRMAAEAARERTEEVEAASPLMRV